MFIENSFNCWKLLSGQSAAKHSNKNEGSTTSRKTYTQVGGNGEQPEMVEDIVSTYMVTYSSSSENGTIVTKLCEDSVMEELFVAPLHYGFVFFGWLALAISGVLLQVFESFSRLVGKELVSAVDSGLIAK